MDGESKAQDISESDCLNSWKVIASYLGRSVRTVRRWEEQEGLPVHRHKHDRGSTVSAYKSELDVWLERRQSSEISEPLSAESEVKRRHWYFGFAAMATFVLVMMSILVGLHYLDKNDGQQSELVGEMTHKHATKLDWVLVTRVNNQTDLQVFDEPFKHVLEQAVSNTQIADLASEKRTSEILKLMRKPSDTQIDSLLGQEIGLRDERIRIVLTGRVDRFGPDLLISVDFICPDRGVVTASLSEQISDGDPILPAVYRLSERAGDKIDEMLSSIEHDRIALKDVTTSSITALRRYSVAEALMEGDNMSAAIELLQQALQEDPEFATAYAQLAWALYEQGWPEDEYLPQIERALQHLLEISDKERYFISASHHHLTGDLRRAQSLYKTVLILEPKQLLGEQICLRALSTTPQALGLQRVQAAIG